MIRITQKMSETIDKIVLNNDELFLMDIPFENGMQRTVSVEQKEDEPRFLFITVVEKSPSKSEGSYARLEFVLRTGPKAFPHALISLHDGHQYLDKTGNLVRRWCTSTDPDKLGSDSGPSPDWLCLISFEDARSELAVVLDAIERAGKNEARDR